MSQAESKLLKNSFGVALATLASRILGLVRVRLEAMALGGGTTASIWFLALLIPNLFRRLLGEGALGNALTPIIAETEKNSGMTEARLRLAQVLAFLGALLALIVVIFSAGAWLCGKSAFYFDSEYLRSERFLGVCELLPLLMPYAFFICLTGVIGAVLNYAGIFVRPALTAVLFNLALIGALFAGVIFEIPASELLRLLAIFTPIAGAVQLILMLWMLGICGRFPIFSKAAFKDLSMTVKVFKLAAPGLIGFGVLQLSFLIDRLMASYLGDRAVPALTYVDRIIDLPIGLFAVSLGAVLMASMTRAVAEKDFETVRTQLNFSLRHVWFVCAPMAAGVIFFHTEILRVLCLGGKYTLGDLEAARWVAVFYGLGIPFFCSLKVILPVFYSRKDMKRPFYVSVTAIAVNLTLNFILMFPLRQAGLALATVMASVVNNSLLLFLLRKDGFPLKHGTVISAVKSALIAVIAALPVWFALPFIRRIPFASKLILQDLGVLVTVAAAFGIFYLILAAVVASGELKELFSILKRKKHPQKSA